jgi:hypothetical protein
VFSSMRILGEKKEIMRNDKSHPIEALALIFRERRTIFSSDPTSPTLPDTSKSPQLSDHFDTHLSPVYSSAHHALPTLLHFRVLQNDPTEPAKSTLNGENQPLNGAHNRGTQEYFPVFAAFEPPPTATWQPSRTNRPFHYYHRNETL